MTTSKATDFMFYVRQYDQKNVLSGISTAVHEACHMYQSKKPNVLLVLRNIPLDWDATYTVYYISANEEYLVKETPTFPSIEMANEITGDLRSFRWGTYINSNQKILGTQQSGVYGLLDEWAAYYNGFKTTVLNFKEYKKAANEDVSNYEYFLSDAGSTRIAYLEFKFYIVQYLHHASRKKKKIYQAIVNNTEFKKAFHAIDKAYAQVVSEYENRINDIKKVVEADGLNFEETGEYIWIGNSGVGSFSKTNDAFEAALRDPKYTKVFTDLGK